MKYISASLLIGFIATSAFAIGINLEESKTIKSDRIEYNVKTELIKTSGNTEITNASGQHIKLADATITKDKKNMDATDIELWLGQNVYVRAESVVRKLPETIAHHAMFTACDKCDAYGNAWEISGKKVIHDSDEKMLYFHSATFWVYNDNIPVLWLPYYEMPDPSVKYKTGFLSPSFNSTNKMGTQINIPFYINLSDKHDLTTTFSYLTKENPLFQIEHRLNATRSEFRTQGSFTHNKEGKNRWHVFNDDVIELGENARATVYVQRTSDKTYLQKYNFYSYQPYLDSGAKLELFGQNSYVVADTHIFQELRKPYGTQTLASGNILPNIRGKYQTDPFYKETFLTLSSDVLAVSGDDADSQRVIGEARVISPWTIWGGNRITASVATRYDIYNFKNTAIYNPDGSITNSYDGAKTRFLPSAYLEWGLPMYDVKENWTYIIEPRARLTIMQHTNKNAVFAVDNDSAGNFLADTTLFSDNRFSGLDVWENGDFVDYGVRWAAFNKKHNVEVFLGQTYDINTQNKDDNFNDNGFRNGFSDYVGRVTYSYPGLNLSSRFRVDREMSTLQHIENSIYAYKKGFSFSLGHIWDAQPMDIYSTSSHNTHETRFGIGIPITKRLKITASTTYNMSEHFIQRRGGGIFYEHPCYFMSLEFHRDNAIKEDYHGNTTFQFKFGISIDGKHY